MQVSRGLVSRRQARPTLVALLLGIAQCARAQDACIDPSTLVASTVSIARYFADDERPRPSVEGYRATAWFYGSTRHLVSIAHFVDDAPALPRGEWRMVDVRQQDLTVHVKARLLTVIKGLPEGLALLELQEPFPERKAS